MVSPLENSLQLDMYNDNLFLPAYKVSTRLNDTTSNILYCAAFQPHNDIPTDKYLFKDLSLDMSSIEKSTTIPYTTNHSNIYK